MFRRISRQRLASGAVLLAVALTIAVGAASSEATGPRRPSRDEEVLARVPADGPAREARALARRLAAAPRDLDAAARLARLNVDESRRTGDPRSLGHAEAALAAWWNETLPPLPVLLLRATIRQSRHEFRAALADLEAATARAPQEAQAWLTRAVVETVLGRHDDARRSCATLATIASRLVATACLAPIDAQTGRAAAARQAMEHSLPLARTPAERAWAHSILGELHAWNDDALSAERHLATALAMDPDDRYTRAAYADLLLDTGRPAQVRSLLEGRTRDDGLLLRLTLAETLLGSPRAPALVTELRGRHAAGRLRGETPHHREEARFALAIDRDPARALALATAGWAVQREPWDARLLLAAATAAGQPAAAAPVLAWLRQTGFEGRGPWAGAR